MLLACRMQISEYQMILFGLLSTVNLRKEVILFKEMTNLDNSSSESAQKPNMPSINIFLSSVLDRKGLRSLHSQRSH